MLHRFPLISAISFHFAISCTPASEFLVTTAAVPLDYLVPENERDNLVPCHCQSMAARQRQALDPAQAEVQPEMPELGRCELRRVMIASEPGGQLEEHEIVVAEGR